MTVIWDEYLEKIYNKLEKIDVKDVTASLKEYDEELYKKVRVVLEKNFAEKHIRGGAATKSKYAHMKKG